MSALFSTVPPGYADSRIYVAKVKTVRVCSHCGHFGLTGTTPSGNDVVEVLLWIFGLLPGLLYHISRYTDPRMSCAACGNEALLLASTPRAQELIARYGTVFPAIPVFASDRIGFWLLTAAKSFGWLCVAGFTGFLVWGLVQTWLYR